MDFFKRNLLAAFTLPGIGLELTAADEPVRLFPEHIRTVGIVSPACLLPTEHLDRGIVFLEQQGVKVRGGIGAKGRLPKLNGEKLRSRRMPLFGFRNISTLQVAMIANGAGHPIAGPNRQGMTTPDPRSAEHLFQALSDKNPQPGKLEILNTGNAAARYRRPI